MERERNEEEEGEEDADGVTPRAGESHLALRPEDYTPVAWLSFWPSLLSDLPIHKCQEYCFHLHIQHMRGKQANSRQ